MYFDTLRQGEILTITPSGRIDAVGAVELENFISATAVSNPFTSLVFDLRATSYLSSGGLRVLLSAAKKVDSWNGKMALFGLQPYCHEVIRVAGMDKVFNCFTDSNEAYAFCGLEPVQHGDGVAAVDAETMCGNFLFSTVSGEDVTLAVTGDIANILHSRLDNSVVYGRNLGELGYSLGIGAMGNVIADYLPLIGSMMTFNHAVMWTPSDGQELPDYLVPVDDSAPLQVQLGMNVALQQPFNEMAFFTAASPIGVTLETFWHDLLHLVEQRRPGFRGMLWCSMLAEMETAYLTNLKRSPLVENAPENGKTITHPTNAPDWFAADSLPVLRNGMALINGLGVDLLWDLSDYDDSMLGRVFPFGPNEIGGRQMLLNNHAAVFDPSPVEWQVDRFAEESHLLLGTGKLRKVGELQARSMIKKAIIGIGYVSGLESAHHVDSLYARRLDYQLNRNQSLLRAYKNLEEE